MALAPLPTTLPVGDMQTHAALNALHAEATNEIAAVQKKADRRQILLWVWFVGLFLSVAAFFVIQGLFWGNFGRPQWLGEYVTDAKVDIPKKPTITGDMVSVEDSPPPGYVLKVRWDDASGNRQYGPGVQAKEWGPLPSDSKNVVVRFQKVDGREVSITDWVHAVVKK